MKRCLLVISIVVSCRAQSPAFEVVSVKLNRLGGPAGFRPEPGRLTVTNMSLKALVEFAYNIRDYQISGGPGWFDSDRWDVAATASGAVSDEEQKQMLQALLADRFRLNIHHETRDLPVYALSVGKNGTKLQANTDGKPQELKQGLIVRANSALFRLNGVDVPIVKLADFLAAHIGRMVNDRTRMQGTFDFTLEWAPDPAHAPSLNGARMEPNPDGASLFTAVQEQLGLKLESTKGRVEVFIIDRAEKATEN